MTEDVRIALIVGVVAALAIGGLQACVVMMNAQCEETRRAALESDDAGARATVLAWNCR